ncbi:MAG: hypothetical protein M3R65_06215 [Gemmatimonadota bacterium]|nr:hypothetical protein [Gemmatimonadota bacterium]
MRSKTVVRSFLTGLGIALLATACTPERVSGPQAVASTASATASIMASASKAGPVASFPPGPASDQLRPAITRKHALKSDITVTQVIGAKGGTIHIGKAGLTVVFSPGALLQKTPITVTANAGSLISYEFGPHGTQFYAPVAIEQDMKQTTIDKKISQANNLFGGYMPNGTSDIVGDSARVTELHKSHTTIGVDYFGKPQMKTSVFIVWHFSGYILISA